MQKGRHKRKDALAEYSKALGKFTAPKLLYKELRDGLYSELDQDIIGLR